MSAPTRSGPISRDDLQRAFEGLAGDVEQEVERARQPILMTVVAGGLLAVLVAYLIGRRSGRKRSAVVEIRRL